jgi:hypothetical protein
MRVNRFVILLVGLGALAATCLGVFVLAGEGRSAPEPYSTISTYGRVVNEEALAANRAALLDSAGISLPATIRLIAERKVLAYYAIDRASGGTCYANGDSGKIGQFSSIACPNKGETSSFPSADVPLMNESAHVINLDSGNTRVDRLIFVSGFAADGVAAVGVMADDGRILVTVNVQDNVFELADPPADGETIVALDSSGGEIGSSSP